MQELKNADSEYGQQFRNLQIELRERWHKVEGFDSGDCDIIIIPSVSLDQQEMQKVEGAYHYEERHLFSLIRLRNPFLFHTRAIGFFYSPLTMLLPNLSPRKF